MDKSSVWVEKVENGYRIWNNATGRQKVCENLSDHHGLGKMVAQLLRPPPKPAKGKSK